MSQREVKAPRERRRDSNQRRILALAMEMIESAGIDALSMNKLAEAADYTPGALYRYFASKDALLAALVGECLDDVRRSLDEAESSLPERASPLARVFVLAGQANSWTPKVRVRWYSSGTLVRTDTINAPGASVPLAIDQATYANSWNLRVPAALVQPNLSVLADVDPGNLIAESNEGNNNYPISGTPLALSVHTENPFKVTLIPVTTKFDNRTGNVTGELCRLARLLSVGERT